MTYLNPHVYLDTVVTLGGLANQHGLGGRWAFAAGAVTGSLVWFTVLGYGARALSERLSTAGTWRTIDVASGAVMLFTAFSLTLSSGVIAMAGVITFLIGGSLGDERSTPGAPAAPSLYRNPQVSIARLGGGVHY